MMTCIHQIFRTLGRLHLCLACVLLLTASQGILASDQHGPLPLNSFSPHERAWLSRHQVVRIAPDPDFPPVEFIDKDGNYQGIAADFIALLEKKLPLRFEIVALKDWNEVIAKAETREIDMFGAAVPTPERLRYMTFTRPFVEFPAVIITRDSTDISPKLKNLEGMRIAVVSNYAAHDYMRRAYAHIPLEVMPDISSGLRQVSFGKVDAMVLNLASASYYIGKEGITNLKVFQDTDFVYDLSFATRSDWPELSSILQKAVDAITPQERKAILDSWVSLKQEPWRPSPQLIILLTGLVLAAIFGSIIIWNRSLSKQVQERTAALQKELADRLKAEEEKAQLQEQIHRTKKMAALGLLAGGVAHDLNNILAGVMGYPELLLLELPADSSLRQPLLAIRDSGERAAAVVADLLTIARGAASDKNVHNLNQIITAYLNSPEHKNLSSQYPHVATELALSPDLFNIRCSENHIRKIIMNLVLNGAEATGNGTVTIGTENRALDLPLSGYDTIEKGEYVVLTIADTGSGIPAEDLQHIFEPFYSKKKMGRSGTGLGLAVVWNSVHDHQGYINVSSSQAGTCFELYFPITREQPSSAEESASLRELQGHGERIVIIDDEESIRDMASRMLTSLGYEPVTMASGEEALAYMRENSAELLLLDMIMEPGMNGRETYEKILALHPGQRAVIASGFSESKEVKRALQLGAGCYIRKPYSIDKLATAIQAELTALRR